MSEYEHGKARLIESVKRVSEPYDLTLRQKKAQALADKLKAMVDMLDETTVEVFDLENEHDKPPERGVGRDVMPVDYPDYSHSFKGTLSDLRMLAESAERVAGSYPNARVRRALPHAALGYLWLRYESEFPSPTLYNDGPDVLELESICEAAGLHKSRETLRNALSVAQKVFDRHMRPDWMDYILTGKH